MPIIYRTDKIPSARQVIALYENSGLPRPTGDIARIKKMYKSSNLVITAWDKNMLVAVARSITDWVWSCYLADLAIRNEYKKSGIGKKLISLTQQELGPQSMILLLSVPTAMEYYPRIGFLEQNSAFIITGKARSQQRLPVNVVWFTASSGANLS